jgi:hypothetical protein
VDVSARQLELASRHVPAAEFVKVDMTSLDFEPASFDAWLRPGGAFLATWALGAWEGEEEDWEGWGAPMRWSHHGEEANLKMVREAGFEVASAEARTGKGTGDSEETWLWVLARRGG